MRPWFSRHSNYPQGCASRHFLRSSMECEGSSETGVPFTEDSAETELTMAPEWQQQRWERYE